MTGETKPAVARFIGLTGAILLISSSAVLGAYYGFTVGSHQHLALGLVFGAAALGGEILKPLAVVTALDAIRGREFLRGLACVGLAAVCIVYSLAAELSLAAGSRGDLASARELSAATVKNARERRERAAAELAPLAPARSAAELVPLIAALKNTPGANQCEGQPDGPISRRACGQALELQAEAARFTRRTRLEAAIAEADTVLAAKANTPAAAVSAADPLASALSAYASAFGRTVDPAAILPWLALIPVLFLEVGSALSLIVVRALGGRQSGSPAPDTLRRAAPAPEPPAAQLPAPDTELEAEPDTEPDPNIPADDGSGTGRTPPKPGRARDRRRLGRLVDHIRAQGGRIEGGQRELARALGVSKSRMNELLHELDAAGLAQLATGRRGTTIQLTACQA